MCPPVTFIRPGRIFASRGGVIDPDSRHSTRRRTDRAPPARRARCFATAAPRCPPRGETPPPVESAARPPPVTPVACATVAPGFPPTRVSAPKGPRETLLPLHIRRAHNTASRHPAACQASKTSPYPVGVSIPHDSLPATIAGLRATVSSLGRFASHF